MLDHEKMLIPKAISGLMDPVPSIKPTAITAAKVIAAKLSDLNITQDPKFQVRIEQNDSF
jgi:hypothetical protein